jgi:hypothetical protein
MDTTLHPYDGIATTPYTDQFTNLHTQIGRLSLRCKCRSTALIPSLIHGRTWSSKNRFS